MVVSTLPRSRNHQCKCGHLEPYVTMPLHSSNVAELMEVDLRACKGPCPPDWFRNAVEEVADGRSRVSRREHRDGRRSVRSTQDCRCRDPRITRFPLLRGPVLVLYALGCMVVETCSLQHFDTRTLTDTPRMLPPETRFAQSRPDLGKLGRRRPVSSTISKWICWGGVDRYRG